MKLILKICVYIYGRVYVNKNSGKKVNSFPREKNKREEVLVQMKKMRKEMSTVKK
jgi:hypothetical protein